MSKYRGNYSSVNGISRSVDISSVGHSDEHDDTKDYSELEKKKFIAAQPPKENPWHVNPNAAALIAMKFPSAYPTVTESEELVRGNSTQTSATSLEGSNKSSAFQSRGSIEKMGSKGMSAPMSKDKNPGSSMKSSQKKDSGGDSNLTPTSGYGRGRGGRGGHGSSGGVRGRGSYQGGGKSYSQPNNHYTDHNHLNGIPSHVSRGDFKDFPTDYTTLTPVYSPPSDYIMPYLATFPPTYAPPLETAAGIIPIIEEQPFSSYVTVDALTVEMVKNQIEYYFSEENLEKDFFLRRKMDTEGYLPVQLIASFHRVKSMTVDYNVVMAAIQLSDKLEVSEDMGFVRTATNPTKWPILDSVVSLSIPLSAMKISPTLPAPASSTVDAELNSRTSASSPIHSAIPPLSNGITVQATMITANSNISESLNPIVPEFVPISRRSVTN